MKFFAWIAKNRTTRFFTLIIINNNIKPLKERKNELVVEAVASQN